MPLNIYYLDDEEELLEVFSALFSSSEVNVKTFSHPEAALFAIQEQSPDLFFVDFRLPGMTGDKVVNQINPDIPSFLITGELNIRPEADFKMIFKKPFPIKDIRNLIESFAIKNNL